MNKKIFCISAILILILLLSGCTGEKPTLPEMPTDEELIRGVIDDVLSALSAKEFDRAKTYCVKDSSAYSSVVDLENYIKKKSNSCINITLNFSADISKIDIDGDNAQANGYLTNIITCDKKVDDDSRNVTFSLQKVSGSWKVREGSLGVK